MLWLVTFVAVIPLGLLLAHHERLSLRKLSQESHQEEADAAVPVFAPYSLNGQARVITGPRLGRVVHISKLLKMKIVLSF